MVCLFPSLLLHFIIPVSSIVSIFPIGFNFLDDSIVSKKFIKISFLLFKIFSVASFLNLPISFF
jgi:hypothetical protein